MGRSDDTAGKWCILRTAAPRTLLLATSLANAGFDVWTPRQTVTRKRRGKDRHKEEQRDQPITPTFVFARADRAVELAALARAPLNPHPAFSLLHRRDRGIALVRDAALKPLRSEEERHHLRLLKKTRRSIAPGSRIRLPEGPFAGLTGIVERGDSKAALVNFGAGFVVSIASYLLTNDVVQEGNRPIVGLAA